MNLVIYSTLMLLYMSFTMIEAVINVVNDDYRQIYPKIVMIGIYCVLVILTLVVTGFCIFHLMIIMNGLSTIEFREKYGRKEHFQISPYNVSYYSNFTHVFGNNPLLWFLPIAPNLKGKGLKFKTRIEKQSS